MESVVRFFVLVLGALLSLPYNSAQCNLDTVQKERGRTKTKSSRVLLPSQELEEIVVCVCARKDCRLCRVPRISSGPLLPYPLDFAVRFRIVALFAIRCASETAHHKRGYGCIQSLSLSLSLDLFGAAASLLLLCALFACSLAFSLSRISLARIQRL